HQIMMNLIHNAHKFTPSHGSICVNASSNLSGYVMVSVSDTGPGISQEAQTHLFQPFYQAHRAQEIGTQGLGLGLSIVKQLVELHGGTITVESQVGEGAIFHVCLPAEPSAGHSASVRPVQEPRI